MSGSDFSFGGYGSPDSIIRARIERSLLPLLRNVDSENGTLHQGDFFNCALEPEAFALPYEKLESSVRAIFENIGLSSANITKTSDGKVSITIPKADLYKPHVQQVLRFEIPSAQRTASQYDAHYL